MNPTGVTSRTQSGPRTPAMRVLLVLLASFALVAAACGSDEGASGSDEPSGAAGDPGSGDTSGDTGVEGIAMTNVATGETVGLDEALAPGDKPVLAWFWAPHCPTCRGEAPELDAYMGDNADRVDLVGIGSRDDFEYAEGFLEDTGVSNFDLLWEPSGESWVDNAVAAQPYMILFDTDGEEIERWPGGASVVQIDDALAELA